jgi:hypothetical protein
MGATALSVPRPDENKFKGVAQPQTTLIELVNQVAKSVGHPVTVDIATSQDEAISRLAYYANIAGMELAYMNPGGWNALQKKVAIDVFSDTLGQSEKAFDLPTDFAAMIDDTQWNANSQLPALGPINPQSWQAMTVRNDSANMRFMWRIRNKQLWIKSPPDAANTQTIVFEYLSKYWAVKGSDGSATDIMKENGDYHIYPWQLMVLYTRAKWFENEGFDSSGAQMDFLKALNYELGADKGATSLSLVQGSAFPYLDPIRNLPDSGYGS